MILGGSIVGRIGADTVVQVGGSLITLPDPGLPLGSRVQLVLVPGSTYSIRSGSARGTRRILQLDGPSRIVLRVPRAGAIPARVDLQLRALAAPRMARVADSFIEAASIDRDAPLLQIPAALRTAFALPQQSGTSPQ
jgi:hypothetical protein